MRSLFKLAKIVVKQIDLFYMIQVSSGLLTNLEIAELRSIECFYVAEDGSGLGFGLCPEDKGIDRLAQSAYHNYGAVTNYQNYQGLPMPEWKELPDAIRNAWRNAILSVLINSGYDPIISSIDTSLYPTNKNFEPQGLI